MAVLAPTWVAAHAEGLRSGFLYLNLYVNPANQQVLGWVARQQATATVSDPPYLMFWFQGQALGQDMGQGQRGSARNAMAAVDGAIRRGGVTVGLLQQAAGTGSSPNHIGGQFPMDFGKGTLQILAANALKAKRAAKAAPLWKRVLRRLDQWMR